MTDLLAQDPVSGYKNVYKEAFAREAEAFFQYAVRQGGINPAVNALQAMELDELYAEREKKSGKQGMWIFFLILLLSVFAVWGFMLLIEQNPLSTVQLVLFWGYSIGALIFICTVVVPKLRALSSSLSTMSKEINKKYAQATAYLEPLYGSFSWNTLPKLFSRVIPQVKFDDFLTRERLADFRDNFGLLIQDEPDSTMLGSHSGTFFGYPFIFTEDKNFCWGEKVWSGARTVSYTVYTTDSEGNSVAETHYEVLTATVTKPFPEFPVTRQLFFGHPAAPELSYSREPSSLSGSSGIWAALGKKYRMHKLRKLEQNLTDDSNFTMMSNREFEMLFKSENRDHEIGFRLLFTPLAQQYMVKLLNDQETGYGDDFCLNKSRLVTCLVSEHLSNTQIAPEPFSSSSYDLQKIRAKFRKNSEEFFRSMYFSFAPLFLTPAYNEERLHVPEYAKAMSISENELEGAAASHEEYFRPPESITENIFNIRNCRRQKGVVTAEVESIGFYGCSCVDYVPRLAGDGVFYQVPVEWVEYIPVTRRTLIHACREEALPQGRKVLFRRRGLAFW